jgi:KDO2-lipid IV(A) lauroyltransferase
VKNKPYRYYLYLLLRFGIGLVSLMPRAFALVLAKGLGWAAFYLVSRQRNKTLNNLRTAFGHEKSEKEIHTIGIRVFQNLAMTLVDWIHMKHFNSGNIEKIVNLNGVIERSQELLKEGKGLIFISGHLGNWELMGTIYGMFGFTGGVIGKRIYYEKYNEMIVGVRREKGVPTFYQDENPRELLRQLRKGGVIGIVADQNVEKLEGVTVDYFGKPSYTPVSPIRLAQVSQAPILVGALIREDGRYKVVYDEEPLRVSREIGDVEVTKLTEVWSKKLEKLVRQYPEQWVWMHDRWKTKQATSDERQAARVAVASFESEMRQKVC